MPIINLTNDRLTVTGMGTDSLMKSGRSERRMSEGGGRGFSFSIFECIVN